MLVGNGIPNTSAEAPDFDPKFANDDPDVIDVVEPLADVVEPLLRLPIPNVNVELDADSFLRITFLGFFSDLSEKVVEVSEGEGRDVDDPTENAVYCFGSGVVLNLL